MTELNWPLMQNNIVRNDLDSVIDYLRQDDPKLTHGRNVELFEEEWSAWLGVKHSVLVNSGSSANLLSLAALRELRGDGEVIVPPLTWVSDIAAVIQNGFTPVFVDINRRTLGMDAEQLLTELTKDTRAVFLTHILGYNALTQQLLDELAARNIPLIEDVCESHGATFSGKKLGTFGWQSNFSFYYAHHMSTIEGGMISTNDLELYQMIRMLRSHGLVRESNQPNFRQRWNKARPDLNPEFVFAFPGYNVRPTEIAGIIGRQQLKRLDVNNRIRSENLQLFLSQLDPGKFQTDFAVAGSSNYAFTLVISQPDPALWARVEQCLHDSRVEFRRGLSGGGNQLRQPYLRRILGDEECEKYPNVEYVHFYGCYIGNYPTLPKEKIGKLCARLNAL